MPLMVVFEAGAELGVLHRDDDEKARRLLGVLAAAEAEGVFSAEPRLVIDWDELEAARTRWSTLSRPAASPRRVAAPPLSFA